MMRCLSLADAFRERGRECVFLLAGEEMESLIGERGYCTYVMGTDYQNMEGEVSLLSPLLSRLNPELMVLDSYHVTNNYLEAVRQKTRLVYFDDFPKIPYPVDILVNYNIYAQELNYERVYRDGGVALPGLLLMPGYAPLREQFRGLPCHKKSLECKKVLFSAGGADPAHVTLGFLTYLSEQKEPERREYHVILGSVNPDREQILTLSAEMDFVHIHEAVRDMRSLMMECDLAISAAGTTLYELCACGIPTITYILADNQIMVASAFDRFGYMVSAGDIRTLECPGRIIYQRMAELAGNPTRRFQMMDRMQELVDGNGAGRIAAYVLKEER